MTSSLNLLMICPRFAPFVGGTEIHTRSVGRELILRGHNVTVITTDLSGSLPRHEIVDGIDVYRTKAFPKKFDLYFAPRLAAYLDRGRWDVVHVQGYHTAVAPLALRAAQKRNLRTALTFHSGGHSSTLRNFLRPLHHRLIKPYLTKADLLIGVSNFEAEFFSDRLDLPKNKIKVIPNGVSDYKLPLPDINPAPSKGPTTILSIGRLVRYKGHHKIIRAMPRIIDADSSVNLIILGYGPYHKNLKQLAERLGVSDHVSFDYVESGDRERMRRIMSEATMAMFLSDYESHGMAAHEALAAGLTLVVSNQTALADLVSAGLAQAVPHKATDHEIAEIALRALRVNEDTRAIRNRNNAIQAASVQKTWPEIASQLEAAYLDVLAKNSPAVETQ